MAIDVEMTDDPSRVLQDAGEFLESDPVRNNLVLTLLQGRVANPVEGRYLVAFEDGVVVGVVFQSPLTYHATITPMAPGVAEACAAMLGAAGTRLPGVSGEAGSAAAFAGYWTELTKSGASPSQGQRIYEADCVTGPADVSGNLRRARESDLPQLVEWLKCFHADVGEPLFEDPATTLSHRIAAGQFWVWEDPQPVSMAALTAPVAGVTRVQAVYTPPQQRNHGYAAACVAPITAMTRGEGTRCILYTDLANPVSNSVYRRIGYRAVAEALRYDFA
jgi:uncharacterized protein